MNNLHYMNFCGLKMASPGRQACLLSVKGRRYNEQLYYEVECDINYQGRGL